MVTMTNRVPAVAPGRAAEGAPRPGRRASAGITARERRAGPDVRRRLQLILAAAWLMDGILQCQPVMFSRAFARQLAATAAGNPAPVADPITWSARLISQHAVLTNASFAAIQLLIGAGIAWRRPTLRLALGASVAWALGVWWLGEGLGSVLTGTASPVSGAPGAVILYALLAVLLWPAATDRAAPFVAGRAIGAPAARGLWLILWGSLACLALQPAARAPRAISSMIADAASGQPGWLAGFLRHGASVLGQRGLTASVLLAVALAAVAAGAFLPATAARPAKVVIGLAVGLAAALWAAEGLGAIFTGSGTDPNSGPLLALIACAYWPARRAGRPSGPQPEVSLLQPAGRIRDNGQSQAGGLSGQFHGDRRVPVAAQERAWAAAARPGSRHP